MRKYWSVLVVVGIDYLCEQLQAPITVPVSSDKFWMLTEKRAIPLPSPFDNKGNYVIRCESC